MGAIINFTLKLDQLDKSKIIQGKNGPLYPLTVSVNNDTNEYGQNVSVFTEQSQEERQAKTKRNYVANGKVVWTDGVINKAEATNAPATVASEDDGLDLPF